MANFLHVMGVQHKEENGKAYTVAFCRDFPGGGWKDFRRLYEGTYTKEELEADDSPQPVAQFGLNYNPTISPGYTRDEACQIAYGREEVK